MTPQEHNIAHPAPLDVQSKVCSRCKLPLPIDDFYRNPLARGGYQSQCKKCQIEAANELAAQRKIENITRSLQPKICTNPNCKMLGVPQPPENFRKDNRSNTGLQRYCKDCHFSKPTKNQRYTTLENGERLKVCGDCKVPQPFSEFNGDSRTRDEHYAYCKTCCKKYNEEQYQKHKEKRARQSREWGKRNKDRIQERNKKVLDEYLQSVKDGATEKTKVCTRCKGEPQPFSNFPVSLEHNDGHSSHCKQCVTEQTSVIYHRNKEAISKLGREQRKSTCARRHVKSSKQNASKKGVLFDMDVTDLYDPRTGELPTHCPIFPSVVLDYEAGPNRRHWASVDRIVPELGYVSGNVCIISYGANTWKSNGSSPEERRRIIQIIAGSRKGKQIEVNQEQGSLFSL